MLSLVGAALRKLLDPRGPLGEVASPDITWKSRLGLPTQSPHVARARMEAPAHVEHALAPARFASLEEAAPTDRVRMVSAFIEEHWAPVYASSDSTDLVAILIRSQQQVGWSVTQRESEQSRLARKARQNAEEFVEVLASAQIQASDAFYEDYYETIAGNDPLMIDGEIVRGEAVYEELEDGSRGNLIHDGTIRGGTYIKTRKQYNAATKGYRHLDKAGLAEIQAAQAEYSSRPVRNVRRAMEAIAGEKLPMHRPVGINFRKDRRSAV